MKGFMFLIIGIPLIVNAQRGGIQFEKEIGWQQVIDMAKAEHKYIFVDCFATWCAPCREMEKNIYTLNSVGNYFNGKFISVKIQMDTSRQDNKEVISWYPDARKIMSEYNVTSLPTFLFFSESGKIVHRDFGYKEENEFLNLGINATNDNKQYYTLLEKYKYGIKDYSVLDYLANTAENLGDTSIANLVAADYTNNYLIHLMDSELYKENNIKFIRTFIHSSNERGFVFFYSNGNKINGIMRDTTYSQIVIERIILKEEINPLLVKLIKLHSNHKPDWKRLSLIIEKKFNAYFADRTILEAKIFWYSFKREWTEYTKNLVKKVDRYGVSAQSRDFLLNNCAWEVFLHSNNANELERALFWSNMAIKVADKSNIPNWMDTNANIRYKLGMVDEAIAIEKRIISFNSEDQNVKNFSNNLTKMIRGEPTWANN